MKNFSNDFFERLSSNLFSENLFKEVIIEIFPKNCEKSKGTPLEFFLCFKMWLGESKMKGFQLKIKGFEKKNIRNSIEKEKNLIENA